MQTELVSSVSDKQDLKTMWKKRKDNAWYLGWDVSLCSGWPKHL